MQSHEELSVWRKAVELSVAVYKLTDSFPAREMYGLSSQMRRAAVSIASNIAEGRRRGTDADFLHFLRMAHGSAAELETQLQISSKLSFCTHEEHEKLGLMITEIGKCCMV